MVKYPQQEKNSFALLKYLGLYGGHFLEKPDPFLTGPRVCVRLHRWDFPVRAREKCSQADLCVGGRGGGSVMSPCAVLSFFSCEVIGLAVGQGVVI